MDGVTQMRRHVDDGLVEGNAWVGDAARWCNGDGRLDEWLTT